MSKVIDFCQTFINNCDSKCNSTIGGFNCSCYTGYKLNTTTNHTCDEIKVSSRKKSR